MQMLQVNKTNEISLLSNGLKGITSVSQISSIIRSHVEQKSPLFLVEEAFTKISNIASILLKTKKSILNSNSDILSNKITPIKEKIDAFEKRYDQYYKEVEAEIEDREALCSKISAEFETQRIDIRYKLEQNIITKEEASEQITRLSSINNEKYAKIKSFQDVAEKYNIDTKLLQFGYMQNITRSMVIRKIVSDKFTSEEWKNHEANKEFYEETLEKIKAFNNYSRSCESASGNGGYIEFASYFGDLDASILGKIPEFQEIQTWLKQNANKLELLLLPVIVMETNHIACSMLDVALAKLFMSTKVYGKKDNDTIVRNTEFLKDELREYSLYSVIKGIEGYVKSNSDFPSLLELINAIKPHNERVLRLYANINFCLSVCL